MLKKLIGDKAFYKRLFLLMLPIMVQNGITNFVSMLDNIMIGSVGTAEMTGVAVTNQLFFVFNLCVFGAVSGAGIFGAQFYGSGDHEGLRNTFRFKLLFGGLLAVAGIGLFFFCGQSLIGFYMQGESPVTDAAATMAHARSYMLIMLIGLLPYTVVQCYSSTLRETGNPLLPMLASGAAVVVNLVFNYILIFGKLGAPALGVNGAAIATVLSRFVELAVVVLWTYLSPKKFPFMKGAYRTLLVPGRLVGQLLIKGLPLMLNETVWAAGVAMVNQCYSVRGLDAVAAINISQTFWNVFSIAYVAVGSAISIILGQMLGAGQLKEAKGTSYKLIAFSFAISAVFAAIYIVAAEFIPLAYNTEPEIRQLATRLMQISALAMPFDAICHASYFTLRSGGKMLITFIFDCGFMWGLNVMLAFVLSRFTALPILVLFAAVQAIAIFKSILGVALVKQGFWIRNIIQ